MSPWKLQNSSTSLGRTYTRPLGLNEYGFYLDSCFNGTADFIHHLIVEAEDRDQLFHEENVSRTWTAVKQRFPLLGTQLQVDDSSDSANFVVSERLLAEHPVGQLEFRQISSADEAHALIEEIINGPQRNFVQLPVRVFILNRVDNPRVHHVLINTAHFIGDATSSATVNRTFLDILTQPDVGGVPDLQERLDMVPASEDLNPTLKMSKARQRWRRAIADVVYHIRVSKAQGGHALPRTFTPATYRSPARNGRILAEFTVATSSVILDNCRRYKFTFGAAMAVLGQIATARLLHRRYLRGEISEEEWEHRKIQPVHSGGPMTLRPFVDSDWLQRGGASEVFVCISYFRCMLPFMPTASNLRPKSSLLDGAPSYESLLSFERFIFRCNLVKKQMNMILKHPLLVDMAEVHLRYHVAVKRRALAHWRAVQKGQAIVEDAVVPNDSAGAIVAYGWSSVGNTDVSFPLEYPLPASHPLSSRHAFSKQSISLVTPPKLSSSTPEAIQQNQAAREAPSSKPQARAVLRVLGSETHLHPRSAEFYLASASTRDQLKFQITWDKNVYDQAVIEEWLAEVKAATEWYLGQDAKDLKGKL